MATVNKTTLLFENLTGDEAEVLKALADQIVFGPSIPEHALIRQWVISAGFTENQWLLSMTTVFPARAYASVVNYLLANSTTPNLTHDFQDGNGPVPAHQHTNGGGWVADSASVAATAYVGPKAKVYGNALVCGKARIYDNAEVFGKARIYGNAEVFGGAKVSQGNLT